MTTFAAGEPGPAAASSDRRPRPTALKLGLALQYFTAPIPTSLGATVREAEAIGYESVWCGESYGSDAFTPLAYLAAHTERMRLGTSLAQIPARPPTAAAMAAATLDHLSAGRVVLGLGSSGPQVAEGWYGQPYERPLVTSREYVAIVRQALRREAPVAFDGSRFSLPLDRPRAKALRSNLPPLRDGLPVHLGAEGPANIALAAEIADGWHALFYSPRHDGWYRKALEAGFARRSEPAKDFEVVVTVNVVLDDDVERAADRLRPMLALYIGGMGVPGANFHHDVFARRGWEAQCARIEERFLAGDRRGAAAAVPTRLVEEVALVGPPRKVREEMALWASGVATTLAVVADPSQHATIAAALLG